MLSNLFGGKDDNMLIMILLILCLCGDNKGSCGGGLFGGDNMMLILILFLCMGQQDGSIC